MRSKTTTDVLAGLPADLLAKVQAEAEQDADDVAEFIRRAAIRCSAKVLKRQAIYLPREALLGLGLAMRLHRWERIGLPIHLAFGLPSSTEVVKFVTRNMWHSCGRFRITDHFKGKDPVTRKLFRAFKTLVRTFGPATVYAQSKI